MAYKIKTAKDLQPGDRIYTEALGWFGFDPDSAEGNAAQFGFGVVEGIEKRTGVVRVDFKNFSSLLLPPDLELRAEPESDYEPPGY